jgi:hypothetical protein
VLPLTNKSPPTVRFPLVATAPVEFEMVIAVVPSFALRFVALTVGVVSAVVTVTLSGSPTVMVCPETEVLTSFAVPEIVRVCEVATVLAPPVSASIPRVTSTASTYALTAACVGRNV